MFEELIRAWDGEVVATRFDESTSAWMFIGVHSTILGPGFGGIRMKAYPSPGDGLGDVLRLSSAMTLKNSLAGIPFGGAKAVVAVAAIPTGDDRRGLMERYAGLVASLGGTYITACDMNTTESDMDVVGTRCPFVMGRTVAGGGSGSSAPATATGVFHGIRAALKHAVGSDVLDGRTIVVQGAGAVGSALAELLADAGAAVIVGDVDEERARSVADRVGAKVVAADDVYDTPCDVFSPCATGGVLNVGTIPRLRARVIAGAANNQLDGPGDGERLAELGILYAPDYVVNAGGVLFLAGRERLGWSSGETEERLAGIAGTLGRVFGVAEADGIAPDAAARRLARERIDASPRAQERSADERVP